MTNSKVCFVISPIGSVDSPQRKRADIVLKHIFKPAFEPLGYEVVRADEISTPGSITLQVLEKVLESQIVIADLTDHNPNVFYELAVRHAVELPVIHVIAADQKIPFDVADLRTIPIDIDLDGAERSRQAIIAQAKDIEAGHLGQTPVKVAGALKHLSAGKSDDKLILKQILDSISEMKDELQKLNPKRSFLQFEKDILSQITSLSRSMPSLGYPVEPIVSDLIREELTHRKDQVVYLAKSADNASKADYVLLTGNNLISRVTVPRDLRFEEISQRIITNLRPSFRHED
jgi:hypothetical protein